MEGRGGGCYDARLMASWRRVLPTLVATGLVLASIHAGTALSQEDDDVEDEDIIVHSDEPVEDPGSYIGPPAGSPPAERQAWLAERIDSAISYRGSLRSAAVGIGVVDLTSGQILYERNPDRTFNIASNTKIITSAAALALLGPDFRYRTSVYVDDLADDGSARTLYVRGRGDPSLGTADLMALADDLVLAGLTRVDGGIVIDASYFDGDNLPPHYDEQPDEHASFRAPIGATSLNFNAVALLVRPAPGGSGPAVVTVDPPNRHVRVTGTVHTSPRGRTRIRLDYRVQKDHVELKVGGQINANASPRRYRKRVDDPVAYFGSALAALLERRGVKVRSSKVTTGEIPEKARRIASRSSPALSVLVRGAGKYSNNFVAESLLKTIAAETRAEDEPASWARGIEAMERFLTGYVGLEPGSFRYGNGSGLFDSSEFSPRHMLAVLAAGWNDFRYSPDLVASLAIAGTDGTLDRRMSGSPAERQVRAKTGTLATVSALSGYAAVDTRTPLAFAVLVEDIPRGGDGLREARTLQDDVARALVLYLSSDE